MPLDPEVAAYLERQKRQPPRSSLDVADTRETMRRAAALGGDRAAARPDRRYCTGGVTANVAVLARSHGRENIRGAAPAFVLTAEYDTLRDEGEAYARKLAHAGNIVQTRRYLGTIHGFFTMQGILRVAREAMNDAGAFLRRHLA